MLNFLILGIVGLIIGLIGLYLGLVAWKIAWLELGYYFAKKDLDIQAKVIELERARASVEAAKTQAQVVKLDVGQAAMTMAPMALIQNMPMPLPSQAQGQAPIAALPSPSPSPLPLESWLPMLDCNKSIVILGETGSGKSTIARLLAASTKGEAVVIDPHGRSKDWPNLKIIGAGRSYDQINAYFEGVLAKMTHRYGEYEGGREDFTPLTVFVDELTSVAEKCSAWPSCFQDVSTEGRKVEMRIVAMVHGKGVKILKLEGKSDLKHGMAFVYLGKHAVELNGELVANMQRPAILEIDGQLVAIDTTHAGAKLDQLNSVIRSQNSVKQDQGAVLSEHSSDGFKRVVEGLDNDQERVIANLLVCGMGDTAIAKHLSGDYNRNKQKIAMVRVKLNGYLQHA